MTRKPKVCILRTAGTNCDKEAAFAFELAGGESEPVHINKFIGKENKLSDYQILVVPGGFSYGDDVAAGKILANELRYKLADDIKKFIQEGKLIIGICNGFQILVKSGLLPGNSELKQEASLILNDSARFEDRWVHLKVSKSQGVKEPKCVWTKDLPETIYLPVAHGEGKFVTLDKEVKERLVKNGQIVFQYCSPDGALSGYPHNPNGSVDNIAGICDEAGRVLGLMPHPERHLLFTQHPNWTAQKNRADINNKPGDGLQIIKNGVEYARRTL